VVLSKTLTNETRNFGALTTTIGCENKLTKHFVALVLRLLPLLRDIEGNRCIRPSVCSENDSESSPSKKDYDQKEHGYVSACGQDFLLSCRYPSIEFINTLTYPAPGWARTKLQDGMEPSAYSGVLRRVYLARMMAA